ncbi:hypothetical protein POM88_009831 [Heracleum sosnowskyi]|uniref:Transposase-associated domain-containing protein n=1 Tax=Heracleum sosnowskyi TaxID=360622 RepID=A0AAD8J9V9_9APIA|nr:hypothetical protein POM88_009831 [Heracleum sosnowskyi]
MTLDRSWIGRNQYNEAKYLTEEYNVGVENFIKHAIENMQKEDNGRIRCLCRECENSFYKYPSTVRVDLYRHGIMPWYTIWDCHGEKDTPRVQVGKSYANINYRDDDMYDAHDDDFEDCENFEEEPNATTSFIYEMEKKMRKVRSELTLEEESTDEPPSPCTQKELYRKKDLIATMQARSPNRGRILLLLRPQTTVRELLGAREAAQWASSKEKTSPHDNAIADEIYSMMSMILDEVRQMVCSFPMREVKKSDLDERVRNLAAAALPDPSQHASQSHYVRAATGLLRQILKDNDKVIAEENLPLSYISLLVHDAGNDEAANYNQEDVDEDAHMFPLSYIMMLRFMN